MSSRIPSSGTPGTITIAELPSIRDAVVDATRRAGFAGYAPEFEAALVRRAEAAVRLREAPPFDPDRCHADAHLLFEMGEAKHHVQCEQARLDKIGESIHHARLGAAGHELPSPMFSKLLIIGTLVLLTLVGAIATAGLFTVSIDLVLVGPYVTEAFGSDVAERFSSSIAFAFGVLASLVVTGAFPVNVLFGGGRTSWGFKIVVLGAELVFAGALGYLRHGASSNWADVLCVSAIEGCLIIVISMVALGLGQSLARRGQQVRDHGAAEAEIAALKLRRAEIESQLGHARAEQEQLVTALRVREDDERLACASAELAAATASLTYATEVAAMACEVAQNPGNISLGEILRVAISAQKHSQIAGRLQ